jgi:cytochrome c oxidase cbb3-type subunit 3
MRDRVLGHADESDGIEEYDNPLPNWWLGLLYFTIIWAVVYGIHYHFIAGRSEPKALAAELAAAEAVAQGSSGAAAATVAITPRRWRRAGDLCRQLRELPRAEMQGGIGPSLVDTVWIHGSAPEQILATITNGVPEKGMLTWGPILGPEKVAEVAAYVVSQNRAATGQQ